MRFILGLFFCVCLLFIADVIVYIMDGETYLYAMDRDFVYFMTGVISATIFDGLSHK